MTDTQIKAEQESIDKAYAALYERVVNVCLAVVKKICDEHGWNFSSAYATRFTSLGTEDEHDFYDGNHKEYRVEHEWPDDFQKVFDWAERVANFPNMIYEDGKWVA